jgi:hypothetical protein
MPFCCSYSPAPKLNVLSHARRVWPVQVTHNLHSLAYLKNLMRMVRALLQSNNLHIEPYVRVFSPSFS